MPLLALLLATWSFALPGASGEGDHSAAHDPHVTYTDMAVEGRAVVCRIRFFKDDLELALSMYRGRQRVHMDANPDVDALFTGYFSAHVTIQADGTPLAARILASGEDVMDREPVWWYTLQFEAPAPVEALTVHNTMMFELYEDQEHVLKVIRFPDETERSYYLLPGEPEVAVTF